MKQFLSFVKKEFLHITRDYQSLIILFLIPVIQIILFGFALKNELRHENISIIDKSKDEMTKKITNKILSSGYFSLDTYLKNDSSIENVFKKGKTKVIIVFPKDFDKNFHLQNSPKIQLILDSTDPNLSKMISSYISQIINSYIFDETGKKLVLPITTTIKMVYNTKTKSVFQFIPGIMALILMLISSLMTSISITGEKENGTMEVLLVSPLRPVQIIIGKLIPYALISMINAAVIIILAITVFDMHISGSIFLLFTESMLFIVTALSLGLLISSLTDSVQTAMMASLSGLMLPTTLLSGFIYPIENMPYFLQLLSHAVPAKWFVIIIKKIMMQGCGFEYVIYENLILTGMILLFLTISIKKFKIRL